IDTAANSLPQVRAGTIKAYALTATTRLAAAPDIPTVDEAGLPGLHALNWQAVFLPKGAPQDIVARLNGAIVSALADATVRRRLAGIGQESLRASSKRRTHSRTIKRPRSRNGGRSSRKRTSRRNDSVLTEQAPDEVILLELSIRYSLAARSYALCCAARIVF